MKPLSAAALVSCVVAVATPCSSLQSAGHASQSRTSHKRHSLLLSMLPHGKASHKRRSRASATLETIPFGASTSFGGEHRRRRPRRRNVVRPPAVDSTLLRFVSEQRLVTPSQPASTQLRPNVETVSSSTVSSPSTWNAETSAAWWGQFNSHRIVSVLLEKDPQLDTSAAELVGEAVQSQALARKVRRQIRSFLKERDEVLTSLEAESMNTVSQSLAAQTTQSFSSPSSSTGIPEQQLSSMSTHSFEDTVEVMLDLGLTIRDVVAILQHTPGVALMRPRGDNGQGETLETTLGRVLNLLGETLRLRRYDSRRLIRTCPGLLTMRRSKAAEQVVVIMSRLGVSANALSRDLPALADFLLRPPASIFRLVSFLASDAIRMPVNQIGPLLRRRECREVLDCVAPIPTREAIMETSDNHNDEYDMADAVDPAVASALWGQESLQRRDRIESTYRRMSKTAWTLRHEIGTRDLGKVIAAFPSVLLLDAEETILPNAHYLMHHLGIWEDDLPRVLQLYPALLGIELERMKQVTDYLLALDVPEENLASIFRSFPHLLKLDVEREMQPVVDFLQSVGIRNLGRFICRLPPILGYSIADEIRPKWNYLASVCADPRFEVTKFPAYFSYPLERVRTRYEYLRRVKQVPTQFLSVDQIMSMGDKDFATQVVGDLDEGRAFLAYCEQRKKSLHVSRANLKKRPGKPPSTARNTEPRPVTATAAANAINKVPIESSHRR